MLARDQRLNSEVGLNRGSTARPFVLVVGSRTRHHGARHECRDTLTHLSQDQPEQRVEPPSIGSEEEFGRPELEASVRAAADAAAEVRARAERHDEREGLLGLIASVVGLAAAAIGTLGIPGIAPLAVAALAIAALAVARAATDRIVEVTLGPVSLRARRNGDHAQKSSSSPAFTPALETLADRLGAQRVALQRLGARHDGESGRD